MRIKLIFLYLLMAMILLLGFYAAIQCIPEPQVEEDPYEYEALMPPSVCEPLPEEPDESEADCSSIAESSSEELLLDFDALQAQNKDFVGWLSIDDSSISLPVVQGKDNSYYLKRTFTKKYSSYGCPFLDTRTPLDGDCLVIHGHNMGYNRSEIFSTLVYYEDPAYAKEHSIIRFSHPDAIGDEYELFAVANIDLGDPSFNYVLSSFDSEEARTAFLAKLQEKSLYISESIPPEGQILILSTCNRRYGEDNRLIIVGIQIR